MGVMVVSDIKHVSGKEVVFHYCGLCGTPYVVIGKAEACESNHGTGRRVNSDVDLEEIEKNARAVLSGRDDRTRYNVVVREAFSSKVHKYVLRAADIKEAAAMVRSRHPRHLGYTIRSHD
jgi:hypothetical protein